MNNKIPSASALLMACLLSCNCIQAQTSRAEIRSMVEYLSADDKQGRKNGSPESFAISAWIGDYFEENGLQPLGDVYYDDYSYANADQDTIRERNVVGWLPGTDLSDQYYVMISAHFDHLGTSPDKEDSVFNGANDNATGVALLLGLVKELQRWEHRSYYVIFAAFSGEEEGLEGSAHFAEILPVKGEKIMLDLNFEMLGRTGGQEPHQYFITGSDYTNLKEIILEFNRNENWTLDTASNQNLLFLLSDNYSFVKPSGNDPVGIPAHTFSIDTPDSPYYHTTKDESHLVDFDNLMDFTLYMARFVHYLGENKIKIKWLNEIQYEFDMESDGMNFQIKIQK